MGIEFENNKLTYDAHTSAYLVVTFTALVFFCSGIKPNFAFFGTES